jgi:dTDP-4-dehydrorhamnose 3,5-epimerase
MKVVSYDAREGSKTKGIINEFMLGDVRPGLLIIPPGVWHAVENIVDHSSALLNLVSHAYDHEQPDHIRLPIDTPKIPYTF